jgi:hypothetical protein
MSLFLTVCIFLISDNPYEFGDNLSATLIAVVIAFS